MGGLKPSEIDLKWLETWNIGSLLCILNIPKVVGHDTFLGKRYSNANGASGHYLTLAELQILTLSQNGTS